MRELELHRERSADFGSLPITQAHMPHDVKKLTVSEHIAGRTMSWSRESQGRKVPVARGMLMGNLMSWAGVGADMGAAAGSGRAGPRVGMEQLRPPAGPWAICPHPHPQPPAPAQEQSVSFGRNRI